MIVPTATWRSVLARTVATLKRVMRPSIWFTFAFCASALTLSADPTQPLTLQSWQMLGGSRADSVVQITTDREGFVYVLGTTESSDFPRTSSLTKGDASPSNPDIFVTKFDPNSWLPIYSFVFGGTGREEPSTLAVGADGSVFVTGSNAPADFPYTEGAFGADSPHGDGFLVRLHPNGGTLLYSARIGFRVSPNNLLAGPEGTAVIVGRGDLVATKGAYRSVPTGALLARLNATGNFFDVVTYLDSLPTAIDVDPEGNFTLAGTECTATAEATPNAFRTRRGGCDIFVTKLDPFASRRLWTSIFGSDGNDQAAALRVGPNGAIWIAGSTPPFVSPQPFPISESALFPSLGNSGRFLVALDGQGRGLRASTYLPPGRVDQLLVDNANRPVAVTEGYRWPGGSRSSLGGTNIVVLDEAAKQVVSTLQIPQLQGTTLARTGDRVFAAATPYAAGVDRPMTAEIRAYGALGASDIAIFSLAQNQEPLPELEADLGQLGFQIFPGQNAVRSSFAVRGGREFAVFGPYPLQGRPLYAVSTRTGLSPATIDVDRTSGSEFTSVAPLLVAALGTRDPFISLPVSTERVRVQGSVNFPILSANPGQQFVDGTLQLETYYLAQDGRTRVSTPGDYELDLSGVPASLSILGPARGVTPAQLFVRWDARAAPLDALIRVQLRVRLGTSDPVWLTYVTFLTKPAPIVVPEVLVSPNSVAIEFGGPSDPVQRTIFVRSSTPREFRIEEVSSRLTVTPQSGTTDAELTLRVDPNGLPFYQWISESFVVVIGAQRLSVGVNLRQGDAPRREMVVQVDGQRGIAPGGQILISNSPALVPPYESYRLLLGTVPLPIERITESSVIEARLPAETQLGPQGLYLTRNGAFYAATSVNVVELAPARYPAGPVSAYHLDGAPVTKDLPARVGEVIVIRMTGVPASVRQVELTVGLKNAVIQDRRSSETPGVIELQMLVPWLQANSYRVLGEAGGAKFTVGEIWIE